MFLKRTSRSLTRTCQTALSLLRNDWLKQSSSGKSVTLLGKVKTKASLHSKRPLKKENLAPLCLEEASLVPPSSKVSVRAQLIVTLRVQIRYSQPWRKTKFSVTANMESILSSPRKVNNCHCHSLEFLIKTAWVPVCNSQTR